MRHTRIRPPRFQGWTVGELRAASELGSIIKDLDKLENVCERRRVQVIAVVRDLEISLLDNRAQTSQQQI